MVVHKEKMDLLKKTHGELELSIAKMRLEDLRAENFKKQYEVEQAVSKHYKKGASTSHARTGHGVHASPGEVEALMKKMEAEELGIQAWARSRTLIARIHLIEGDLHTLEKIMSTWVENPGVHIETLFEFLTSDLVEFENAFQLAGLDCRCSDAKCEFPFEISDAHREM
ncbi:hypothetical protein KC19_3G144100 [Ceratodon purpureus]|uniref:Uncharacterized protein n=1 Tax=Ceratodon purpureus TaxID=3225 RepID=A0A8T0IKX1_CERPU|nr:hypothetical protein KC19_3G144100 [Ceratodon purpureus]